MNPASHGTDMKGKPMDTETLQWMILSLVTFQAWWNARNISTVMDAWGDLEDADDMATVPAEQEGSRE